VVVRIEEDGQHMGIIRYLYLFSWREKEKGRAISRKGHRSGRHQDKEERRYRERRTRRRERGD
jgi:hypothetical protein